MANRYWVGGAGNWDGSSTTHWSTASNGATGASVPTSADDVFFDNASGITTALFQVIATAVCRNLNIQQGNFTAAASITIQIYGSLTFNPSVNSFAGTFQYLSTSTGNTISLNGFQWTSNTIRGSHTFNGVGGSWTFLDNIINTSNASAITINAGSVTFPSSVSIGSVVISGTDSKTIDLGSGVWTLYGTATAGSFWNDTSSGATINAANATITLFPSGTGAKTFIGSTAGGGVAIGTLNIGTGTTSAKPLTISGNNTFTNFVNLTTSPTVKFTGNSTNTIYNWNYNGTSGANVVLTSSNTSPFNLVKGGGGIVNASYLTVSTSTVSGGNWNAFLTNGNIDSGGNTGWKFIPILSRLTSTGTLFVNGSFDEVSYNPTILAKNLLTYSEQFDNSIWTKPSSTITANATTAPDGTTTADKLVANNGASLTVNDSTGAVYQQPAIAGTATFSVYAKAAEISVVRIRERAETGCRILVDLTTGQISYESGNSGQVSATATLVGNGWYRITCTRTPTTSSNYDIKQGGTTGDGTSGVYIWGAQFETSSTPTFYVKTTTSTYDTGFATRIDPTTSIYYNTNSIDEVTYSNPSKNLLSYTENFTSSGPAGSNTGWGQGGNSGLNILSTHELDPNGNYIATKFGYKSIYAQVNQGYAGGLVLIPGQTYTLSVSAKSTYQYIALVVNDIPYTSGWAFANYDLTGTNTSGAGSYFINCTRTPEANGFFKCTMTFIVPPGTGVTEIGYWLGGYNGTDWTGYTMTLSQPQLELGGRFTYYVANSNNTFVSRTLSGGTVAVTGQFDEVTGIS